MIAFVVFLAITVVSVDGRNGNLISGLAVIRDRVTHEEISKVILNPRKRDLTTLSSAQNEIEAKKRRRIINRKKDTQSRLQRDVIAVKKITTRLRKNHKENDIGPDHYVNQDRAKRVVITRAAHKPKVFPAAFLTSVARIIVPARPESKATKTAPESMPRLLRLSDAKKRKRRS